MCSRWATRTSNCCRLQSIRSKARGVIRLRIIRADQPLWDAGRFSPFHRQLSSGRNRRDHGLGAGSFSERCTCARASSTALISTSTWTRARASNQDWGTLIFNFGRNEVRNFLIGERALLARPISHRRSACGCGGLDALSGLFAQGRAMDPERFRRPRKPRCHLFPETVQRSLLRAFPRHHDHRRGINRLARRFAPDLSRRVGFRLQMEHGLDARLPGIHELDPIFRRFHHGNITFSLLYAFQEHFVLVLSHDEVVYGKRSLLSKMPGDVWQKFANLRMFYGVDVRSSREKTCFYGRRIRPMATSGITMPSSTGNCCNCRRMTDFAGWCNI